MAAPGPTVVEDLNAVKPGGQNTNQDMLIGVARLGRLSHRGGQIGVSQDQILVLAGWNLGQPELDAVSRGQVRTEIVLVLGPVGKGAVRSQARCDGAIGLCQPHPLAISIRRHSNALSSFGAVAVSRLLCTTGVSHVLVAYGGGADGVDG